MKILQAFILFSIFSLSLCGQAMEGAGFTSLVNFSEMRDYGIKSFSPNSTIVGSSLLFDKSRVGSVVFKNDSKSAEVKLNYDSYNEFVVVETEGKTFAFPIKYVDTILFQDAVLGFNDSEVIYLENSDEYFLGEILANGKLKLIKRQITTIKEPTYNPALDTGNRNSKFVNTVSYYLVYKGEIIELPKRRKKAINDERLNKKIRQLLKSSKINLTKKDELVDFVNEFNANN